MRSSNERDSRICMVLLSAIFNENCPGPSIINRPASPNSDPVGFTQVLEVVGEQNAAVLNHSNEVGLLSEIDCPGTRFARCEPLTPRPISTLPPRSLGVK